MFIKPGSSRQGHSGQEVILLWCKTMQFALPRRTTEESFYYTVSIYFKRFCKLSVFKKTLFVRYISIIIANMNINTSRFICCSVICKYCFQNSRELVNYWTYRFMFLYIYPVTCLPLIHSYWLNPLFLDTCSVFNVSDVSFKVCPKYFRTNSLVPMLLTCSANNWYAVSTSLRLCVVVSFSDSGNEPSSGDFGCHSVCPASGRVI